MGGRGDGATFAFVARLRQALLGEWRDTLMLGVPGGLYLLQNNIIFVALTHLDAATYQVTYQLKILTTAVFSVAMLGKRLERRQWLALGLLFVGVALVQLPTVGEGAPAEPERERNVAVGLAAVLAACLAVGVKVI